MKKMMIMMVTMMTMMMTMMMVVAQECRKYLKWEAHEKPLTDLEDDDIHPHFKNGNLNRAWAEFIWRAIPGHPMYLQLRMGRRRVAVYVGAHVSPMLSFRCAPLCPSSWSMVGRV